MMTSEGQRGGGKNGEKLWKQEIFLRHYEKMVKQESGESFFIRHQKGSKKDNKKKKKGSEREKEEACFFFVF
jgi:hypothetical protein